MDFPPLADRPDDLESHDPDQEEEGDLTSQVVLDVLSFASDRGLSITEMLELGQRCVDDAIDSLCNITEHEMPETIDEDEKINTWLIIGRLEVASHILNSIVSEEDE